MHQTVHLCIVQPQAYPHSVGFVDYARFFRYQLRRLGCTVSIGKNRLRADAINLVFGAHLGFPVELLQRHVCLFVNLEQLGQGGAQLAPQYLELLRHQGVLEYHQDNCAAYGGTPERVALFRFGYAPYLQAQAQQAAPLPQRTIDLLFFGSLNERRQAFLERVRQCGRTVTVAPQPLYGAERDALVQQAKAVLNCHYYESSRFEQARAFHCLSLGTPVISERSARTQAPAAFEDAVFWLEDADVEAFFRHQFASDAYYQAASAKLAQFAQDDPLELFRGLLATVRSQAALQQAQLPSTPLRPTRVQIGSGKDYLPGWLNIDILERTEPDLLLDLAQPLTLPLQTRTRFGQSIELAAGQVEQFYANNVLEHVPDLPQLMLSVLTLLKPGGQFLVEVPYEHAPTAWQDPTHVRALNENSWVYYTDWFWYLGWFDYRFEITAFTWLNAQLAACDKSQAAFMRVALRKRETSSVERSLARAMRPDFGGIAPDELPPA